MNNFGNCPWLRDFGFFDYQLAWLADDSRFKIGLWSRQSGKDFCAAAEAVFDALTHPGSTWIVLAAGERQALESIAKAKDWARTMDLIIDAYCEERGSAWKGGAGALLKSAEIVWANGSRFIALPAKPETVRGYSANLILTEFAFHDDPEGIWRAIYPSISNSLKGGEKKLRIISTPNGIGNKFAELWHGAEGYSRHFTDIYAAVRSGLQLDIEQLKRGLNDPEAWAQEYECQFQDGHSVLLPYDLIESCEAEEATENIGLDELAALTRASGQELFIGVDFGRKHHLTVAWILQRRGAEYITREVLALRNLSTPEQVNLLAPRIRLASRVAMDFTGGGIGLGDYLVQEFGEWNPDGKSQGKIELCQFTTKLKGMLFPRLRTALEKREVRIPRSREIREDLHAIQRIHSMDGQINYRSIQSGDGHSDRGTALALALRAAQEQPAPATLATSFEVPNLSPNLAWAARRPLSGRY
jgi:phage FluMu gp28-like protein